jgi:hypothetical protein
MGELFEKKRRLMAEFAALARAGGLDRPERKIPYDKVAPLLEQSRSIDDEVALKRRMLASLLQSMLGEMESHVRAGRMTLASGLLKPTKGLAALIYEEKELRWGEVAEELANYRERLTSDPGGRDFAAELSQIMS